MANGFSNFLGGLGRSVVHLGQATKIGRAVHDTQRQRELERRQDAQYEAATQRYGDISGGDPTLGAQQEDYSLGLQQRRALGALTSYRDAVKGGNLDPDQRGQVYDRLVAGLRASGLVDEQQAAQLRPILVSNPEAADDLIAGLSFDPTKTTATGPTAEQRTFDYLVEAAGDAENTARSNAARVALGTLARAGTARVVDVNGVPTVVGAHTGGQGGTQAALTTIDQEAAGLGALEEAKGEGRARGTARGEAQANLPVIEQTFAEINNQIDDLLNNPNLEAITGLPSVRGLTRGGLGGNIPPIPGTPAASAVAQMKRLGGQIRLQAYERLKGAGQITEAESQFATEAAAALDRAQSYDDVVSAVELLRNELRGRLGAAQQQAGATPAAEQPRYSTTPPPSGSLRQQGESIDDTLTRLGL